MTKKIFYLIFTLVIIIAAVIIITIFLPEKSKLYEFIFNANNEINSIRNQTLGHFNTEFDNYLQFIPIVILLILKLGKIDGVFNWKKTIVFIFLSLIMTQTVVNILKFSTVELRPDASDFLSFPSGHTATAFMSATVLYFEYKNYNKTIIAIGYICAFTVALLRILNNRHWLFDVIIGAVLGILLTYISYLLIIYFSKNRNHNNRK